MKFTTRLTALKLIWLALLLIAPAYAQVGIAPNDIERVGQSGWQFLKINGDPSISIHKKLYN